MPTLKHPTADQLRIAADHLSFFNSPIGKDAREAVSAWLNAKANDEAVKEHCRVEKVSIRAARKAGLFAEAEGMKSTS